MTWRFQRREGDDVYALWMIAMFVAAFGAYAVPARFERQITAAHERAEISYERSVADERIVGQARFLARDRDQALRDLRRVSSETSLPLSTAALLSAVDAAARRQHAWVTRIEPQNSSTSASKPATTMDSMLSATPLTIEVHGRFRDVLPFVQNLSHLHTLIGVDDMQLTPAQQSTDGRSPTLTATIHAALYRVRLPQARKEARLAATV